MRAKILQLALIISISSYNFSQTTATNFNVDDCHGVNHDLFAELDEGKIIVIAWVMPCGGCISGATAASQTVENYSITHPGKVHFYLADDYGNATCLQIGNWKNNNQLTNAVPFSDSLIDMGDYGISGMPKVIVLGGTTHTVYYNENNADITALGIESAINTALASSTNSLKENEDKNLKIYPNPSNNQFELVISDLDLEKTLLVELKDINGKVIQEVFKGQLKSGQKNIQFSTSNLIKGTYLVDYFNGEKRSIQKIITVD
ncbi:MAG: T9SS type A sorting domain-containing protein [Bacteroidota bacterium]